MRLQHVIEVIVERGKERFRSQPPSALPDWKMVSDPHAGVLFDGIAIFAYLLESADIVAEEPVQPFADGTGPVEIHHIRLDAPEGGGVLEKVVGPGRKRYLAVISSGRKRGSADGCEVGGIQLRLLYHG
ncbi:MAG: hypothetical protein SVR04_06390 [Spirochaetota bacterium]|nr:hypothetical protein [Spirochaetota bacterium]